MSRREAWFEGQFDLDPHTLVLVDETGASTKMARLHGRARRGQLLRMSVPHDHWKTTTFTGALRLTGMIAPMVHDGQINGEWFLAYVDQVLVPTLSPCDVLIMDNLLAHKGTAVRQAIKASGARLLFLPPYSPTSTPSRTPSQSSRRCSEKPLPDPSTSFGQSSATAWMRSHRPNATTTSGVRAMVLTDREALEVDLTVDNSLPNYAATKKWGRVAATPVAAQERLLQAASSNASSRLAAIVSSSLVST